MKIPINTYRIWCGRNTYHDLFHHFMMKTETNQNWLKKSLVNSIIHLLNIHFKRTSRWASPLIIITHKLLGKQYIIRNTTPKNKRWWVYTNQITKALFNAISNNFTYAFMQDITTRNMRIIINLRRGRHFRNQGYNGVIDFLQKLTINKEVPNSTRNSEYASGT